jgi:hypothetical protein
LGRVIRIAYPFLIGLYPIIYLHGRNVEWSPLSDVLRPGLVCLVGVAVLIGLARLVARDWSRARLAAAVAAAVFFSYGHFYNLVQNYIGLRPVFGVVIGRNMILWPAWTLAAAVLIVAILRTRRPVDGLERFACAMAVLLCLMSIGQAAIGHTQTRSHDNRWDDYIVRTSSQNPLPRSGKIDRPDIYYIVLDNYSRADVMKQAFGMDNSAFGRELEKLGFYVARESRANYLGTHVSLPSSMNFDYLQTLGREAGFQRLRPEETIGMYQRCKAVELLRKAGYKFMFFPSGYGYEWIDRANADQVVRRNTINANEFERVLLDCSMLRVLNAGSRTMRQEALYSLEKLGEMPSEPGPKFVFAHVTITHPPFFFDADGGMPGDIFDQVHIDKARHLKLYLGSVQYLNKRIIEVAKRLLADSKNPPVIIIQSDHGSGGGPDYKQSPESQSRILNAYYLPGAGKATLYPNITPVNSLRVVFNQCLHAKLKMLEDVTYTHTYAKDGAMTFHRYRPGSQKLQPVSRG